MYLLRLKIGLLYNGSQSLCRTPVESSLNASKRKVTTFKLIDFSSSRICCLISDSSRVVRARGASERRISSSFKLVFLIFNSSWICFFAVCMIPILLNLKQKQIQMSTYAIVTKHFVYWCNVTVNNDKNDEKLTRLSYSDSCAGQHAYHADRRVPQNRFSWLVDEDVVI